jgi:hypothetical protein
MAIDSEVDVARIVQDADLSVFGGRLGLQRLSLPKVSQDWCCTPNLVIQSAIHPWWAFSSDRNGYSGGIGNEARLSRQNSADGHNCKNNQGAHHGLPENHGLIAAEIAAIVLSSTWGFSEEFLFSVRLMVQGVGPGLAGEDLGLDVVCFH